VPHADKGYRIATRCAIEDHLQHFSEYSSGDRQTVLYSPFTFSRNAILMFWFGVARAAGPPAEGKEAALLSIRGG
jgi:hypothetical protein